MTVGGGRYAIEHPWRLGPEFRGTSSAPIVIAAAPGEEVIFDGGMGIPAAAFAPVEEAQELERLAASARNHVLVATIEDPAMAAALSRRVILPLALGEEIHLPAVFPDEGDAGFEAEPAVAEVSPPAVPRGKEGYGVRAGNPPFQESGRPQGWLGSPEEPRGAWARLDRHQEEMAGSWEQWQAELASLPIGRCVLTGYLEANWLWRQQTVLGADASQQAIHLAQALAYGWHWRRDKPFRLYGLLCELNRPGEWHFDVASRRLFLYPPPSWGPETLVSIPAANGFLELDGTSHVQLLGLNVEHLAGGEAYRLHDGADNLVAGAFIRNSPAGGVSLEGTDDSVLACDLVDLERHVRLGGGRRGPGLLTMGGNEVRNCHIYQDGFKHLKVSIAIHGVGNRFRNNLVHHSIGQAVTVNGNLHLLERNEFFDIGYEEGDGGAVYSGADLVGYGNVYRHNFFHHLMGVPGKVERSGIHLDDAQAGAICVGNVFYKSAANGIFMNGGAGHVLQGNLFIEGSRGIYNVGAGGAQRFRWEQEIAADPEHRYRHTKENYLGRAEQVVGPEGWLREPWRSRFPRLVEVMEDRGEFGRMWPIRCLVEGNLYVGNRQGDHAIWNRMPEEAMAKSIIRDEQALSMDAFVDPGSLDFRFRTPETSLPRIPFAAIGLEIDAYRQRVPDKAAYRRAVREYFEGIPSMPGTRKQIDSAALLRQVSMVAKQAAPTLAGGAADEPPAWRQEVISLPPDFAPGLPKGVETLHFAPGMFVADAEDDWSYVFRMEFDTATFDQESLTALFETYFDGLLRAVDQEAAGEDPAQVQLEAVGLGHYQARVQLIDAFTTKRPLKLLLWIEQDGPHALRVMASPQEVTHPVWDRLRAH